MPSPTFSVASGLVRTWAWSRRPTQVIKRISGHAHAADADRLPTAASEFSAILAEDELADAVVLVYANKQDLPGALDDGAVAAGLGLPSLKARDWAIFKSSAARGEGLFEGLDWLAGVLKAKRK